MNLAFLAYLIVSAACIAYVVGRLLIHLCNSITRPDEALAAILRAGYYLIYIAESGQVALGHFRRTRKDNRARLANAMLPVTVEGREG